MRVRQGIVATDESGGCTLRAGEIVSTDDGLGGAAS